MKITSFLRSYFKEISSALLVGITALIICHFQANQITTILGLMVFFVVFCMFTFVSSNTCKNTKKAKTMRITIDIICVIVFAIFVARQIKIAFDEAQIAVIVLFGVVTGLISDGIMKVCWRNLLKNEDSDAYIKLLINDGIALSEQYQMRLLDPEMEPWLWIYISGGHYLCKEAEKQLFLKESSDYIRIGYIKRFRLRDETIQFLFQMPQPNEWIKLFIEANGHLKDAFLDKFLKLSEAPQLMELIVKRGDVLSDLGEMSLFELPNGKELYMFYRKKYIPCIQAEQKAYELDWL